MYNLLGTQIELRIFLLNIIYSRLLPVIIIFFVNKKIQFEKNLISIFIPSFT